MYLCIYITYIYVGCIPWVEREAEAGDDKDDQYNHDTSQVDRVQVKPT